VSTNARIEVLNGPLAGRVIPLGAGLTVGRVAGNDLVLDDGTVSRRHAQILPAPAGGATVRDLGSRNGITVDGRSAKEGRLEPGMNFSVGRISLRFLAEAAPAPLPAAPQPAPPKAAAARVSGAAGKEDKPPLDKRFLAFLTVSTMAVVSILVIWYQQTHAIPDVVRVPHKLQEGAESFVPLPIPSDPPPPEGHHTFLRYEVKDDAGVLEILQVYPRDGEIHRAIAFRGRGLGQASISLVHEDGRRTLLEITVTGHRNVPPTLLVPPEDAADPVRLERYCLTKLGEAKGLAAADVGQYRRALDICRGIVGLYRQAVPKPDVAVEARKLSKTLEDQLEDRLRNLEEVMQHKAEQKDYDGVTATLREMKDLVEPDSAAFKRLQHLFNLNNRNKADSQPRREGR